MNAPRPARASRRLLAGAAWLALAASASANPHRLDDSASHTVPPQVQMQWRELPPGTPGAGGMQAWLTVNVRIDTRAWVGRSGRVYMVLPRDQASTMEASWSTQGRLLPGRLVSGERALVFAGTLTGPTLQDQLRVRLQSPPDWTGTTRRLNFHFEFDAD